MSILPGFRREREWTHSKFIVWILFSFSEWPRISELLHFVGPVVAGEGQSNHSSLSESELLDLTPITLVTSLMLRSPH
jgi:hypothetical protein